jgi:hypothetical protein
LRWSFANFLPELASNYNPLISTFLGAGIIDLTTMPSQEFSLLNHKLIYVFMMILATFYPALLGTMSWEF